jgi:hypothetical protein
LSSLGQEGDIDEPPAPRRTKRRAVAAGREKDRDVVVAQARQRNLQAFAPGTKNEEQEIRRRYEAGDSIQTTAREHKRSPVRSSFASSASAFLPGGTRASSSGNTRALRREQRAGAPSQIHNAARRKRGATFEVSRIPETSKFLTIQLTIFGWFDLCLIHSRLTAHASRLPCCPLPSSAHTPLP